MLRKKGAVPPVQVMVRGAQTTTFVGVLTVNWAETPATKRAAKRREE